MAEPSELATQALELVVEGKNADALALIGVPPPAADLPVDFGRAALAATLILCARVNEGLAYLDADWTEADGNAAGMAGAMFLSMGLFDPALAALLRAISVPSFDRPAHLVNLGRALTLMGRPHDARAYIEEGLAALAHDKSKAVLSLAECLIAMDDVEGAIASLDAATDVDGAEIVHARVITLSMAGRHDEAAAQVRAALEATPDNIDLLVLSADLSEQRGRRVEAAHLVHKALKVQPDDVRLLFKLVHLHVASQETDKARAAADDLLVLAAEDVSYRRAYALAAHARVLDLEDQPDEARAAYHLALEASPNFVPALSGLGHLLMARGEVDEAVAYLERVRAAAPLQGWAELIQARQVPDDPEVLEMMEQAARRPGIHGPVNAQMLLTVAAAWDRKKNYEKAMTLAKEGNEASKVNLSYDPAGHRAFVDRIMARFSAEFVESRVGWGVDSQLPVFVLGMPRSGTTLVEQILASHSEIFGAGELSQISNQIGALDIWEARLGSGLRYPDCVADLTADESRKMAEKLLSKLRELDPNARHIVDKLPHNFQNIGLIKLLFPNAIIIHCRREPRDIAISNYMTDFAAKFGGMGFAYDLGWIGQQLVDKDRLLAHWHRVFPGQILDVVYEELIGDPETVVRRMIAHIGVEWEPQLLNFQELERAVKTASVWQVRQPIYTTSKERWRHYEGHLAPLEAALAQKPVDPAPMPVGEVAPGQFSEAMRLLAQKRPEEAERLFRHVLQSNSKHAAALHFMGAARLMQGDNKAAARLMRQSIKLNPRNRSWYANLEKVEAALGNEDAASALRQRSAALFGLSDAAGPAA